MKGIIPRMTYWLCAIVCWCMAQSIMAQTEYVPQVGDKITTEEGVYIVSGANLVTNGDFNDGLSGWTSGNGQALSDTYFEIVPDGGPDGSACLHSTGGAGSGSEQSVKTGWAVTTGKTYVLSFWAKRTASGMSSNTQYSRIYASSSATGTDTQIGSVSYKADTWVRNQFVYTAEKPYIVVNLGWLNKASSFDCFSLNELTVSNELATAKLEELIGEATELFNSTKEGTAAGEYKTEVRNALQAAIAAATATLMGATTQEEVNAAVTALQSAMSSYKNDVNPPFELGVGYTFTNVAAGLHLSTADGTVRIKDIDPSDGKQEFYWEKAPEGSEAAGYNLRDKEGTYIYRSGSWDTKASSTADRTMANAIFQLVDMGSYVQIKNMGSGSVLGTDNTSDNSAVYSNKNGTDMKYRWVMAKNTPTAALEAMIEKAQALASGTEIGSEYYQVPQTAMDALLAAIGTAQSALSTISSFEEGNAAATALQTAIDKFNASFNPLGAFNEGETYIITHSGGCLLTATESGNASITTRPEEGATQQQLMTFERAREHESNGEILYYIRSVALGTYLARTGSWDTEWRQAPDTLAAVVSVEKVDGKWLGIKFISTASYLGTDGTSSGQLTYSDKSASPANSHWTIETYVTVVLDRAAWNSMLSDANEVLANAIEGYGAGEFFAEDIAAFRAVIATARSNANKAQDQETLDAITQGLETAIADFEAKAHDTDLLDNRALTAAVAAAQSALGTAVAGEFDGQYPQTAIDNFNAALSAAEKVLEREDATQAEVDAATDALKQATASFAAQRISIDWSRIRTLIADAQQAMANAEKEKGEGYGKYPQTAFDALQAEMEKAQTMMKTNQSVQADVDAEATTLQEAIITFSNSRIPNNTEELAALIAEAEAFIAQADAGEIEYDADYYADLVASIQKGKNAMGSTNQDEIDKVVKILRRDIEIFRIMVTGIDSLTALLPADATIQVFSIDGKAMGNRLDSLQKNRTYILRIQAYGTWLSRKIKK